MRNPLVAKAFFSRVTASFFVIGVHATSIPAVAGATAGRATPSGSQVAQDSGLAVVRGIVTDSLNGGYLSGAIVAVSGTGRMAITDSIGRFRIDGIAPGTRRIDVYHDALDEIGLSLVSPQIDFRGGDSLSFELAFPSAASIVTKLCRASDRALGPAAVFGQVVDADSNAPIAGARISVEWVEYVVNQKRVGTSLENRNATSAADGHFRVCGLPAEFTAGLSASFGGDTTAKIPVRFNPIMAAMTLRLAPGYATVPAVNAPAVNPPAVNPPAVNAPAVNAPAVNAPAAAVPAKQGSQRAGGSLTGKVVDPKGGAVPGARVAVDRPGTVALTGADGRFALHGVRPGTRSLYVRRLGYQPVEVAVDVSAATPRDLTVELANYVPMLDTVVVTAMLRDLGLERVGFSRRRKTGMGTYLGPEEIARRRAAHFVDLFTTVPIVRRSTYSDGRPVLVGRRSGLGSGCVNYFVDDVPWLGGGVEDFIMPSEVGAIEVYSAAFTPGQFRQGGRSCETVVVWTKPKLRIF